MNKRLIALVPAALLAVTLTGCGSDDEGGADSDSSSESSQGSENAEGSEGSEDAEGSEGSEGGDATGDDYATLISDFYDAGNALEEPVDDPETFNEVADLPEGVTIESIDAATSSFCIQDATKDIALALESEDETDGEVNVVLYDGLCEGGDEVSRIVPEGQDDATVEGDEELGQPVADFFIDTFGG